MDQILKMEIEDDTLEKLPKINEFKKPRSLDRRVKKNTKPVLMYQCSKCTFQTKLDVIMYLHMGNYHKPISNKSEDKNDNEILKKDADDAVENDTLEKIPKDSEFKRLRSFKRRIRPHNKNNNEILKKDVEDAVEDDTLEKIPKDSEFKRLRSFKRSVRPHNNNNNSEPVAPYNSEPVAPYQCSECAFHTIEKSCLFLHMETVHDLNYRKGKLKRKSFRKEKLYSCSECGYKTKILKNFESHRGFHQNCSKLYKCSTCSFSTNYKGSFNRHCLSHSKIKSFSCNVRPYSSNRKEHLKTHILKHKSDNKKKYKCDECNFESFWKESYTRHVKARNSRLTQCPYCDFKCIRKSYIKRHLHNKHKNDVLSL